MTHKTAMLTGAALMALACGATLAPAMAEPIPPAFSYADLLVPVPDALARIDADDQAASANAVFIPAAQINVELGVPHHHHHHHHHRSARWYRAHGYTWNGQVWIQAPPPMPHHHHHHHHHQNWR
jgi:hypothetical protein